MTSSDCITISAGF